MKRLLIILLIVTTITPFIWGQAMQMNIDRLFQLCDENSKELKLSDIRVQEAEQGVKVAKSNWSPTIDFSVSASYLGSGVVMNRDFTNPFSAEIPPFGNNLAIEASQVLYSGGAFSSQIKMAELGVQMAELSRTNNRQAQHFLMVSNYLELYKLRNQAQVYQKNIELTEKLLRDIRSKQSEGVVLKNDVTRYELQLENIQLGLVQVQNAISILNHNMVITLGLPESTEIIPDTTFLANLPLLVPENEWQEDARESNNAIKLANLSIKQSEAKQKLVQSEMIPKIQAFAANKLDGPILIEVPSLNNNIDYWYAGVGIKYSFSSLYKSNRKLKQTKFETERQREQQRLVQDQIEIAVNSAFTSFSESFSVYDTRRTGVALARQNYDVVNKRYLNDLALITDMLDATTSKLNAELMLENAKANIFFNYFKLKQLTSSL